MQSLKRDRFHFGSSDTLDDTRHVRLKPTNDKLEIDKCGQIESSAGASERESSKSSAEAVKRGQGIHSFCIKFLSLKQLCDILQTMAVLTCEDTCIDGTFRLPDVKDGDANHILETDNINSSNTVSEQEKTHSSQVILLHNVNLPETLEEIQVIELCPSALSFLAVCSISGVFSVFNIL